jgi:hypothetical protein
MCSWRRVRFDHGQGQNLEGALEPIIGRRMDEKKWHGVDNRSLQVSQQTGVVDKYILCDFDIQLVSVFHNQEKAASRGTLVQMDCDFTNTWLQYWRKSAMRGRSTWRTVLAVS